MGKSKDDNIRRLKKKLKTYTEKDIEFNDPHFTQQMILREGKKEDVIKNLLNPDKLVYSYCEKGKYGDTIHCLHFRMSNTRTMRLPMIFDTGNKKSLYIITYIMRHRSWQSMVRKRRK